MGAEDFSYVLQRTPGAMMFLGGTPQNRDPGKAAPNHSNRVFFDESAMTDGIAMYVAIALAHLQPEGASVSLRRGGRTIAAWNRTSHRSTRSASRSTRWWDSTTCSPLTASPDSTATRCTPRSRRRPASSPRSSVRSMPSAITHGSRLVDGQVVTPDGWADAYGKFVDAGWGALPFDTEFGGGGFPDLIGIVLQEMMVAANMSFSLGPLLTQGAIHALEEVADAELTEKYLSKLVTGEWTGTMNLTEPEAGSDVGALRTKAVPNGDGSWSITGNKIFITYGDHDMTDNIVHLVLARTPDAPAGTKGISCFLVPKYLVNADGSIGERNDVTCVSLEHKMGIHASPTCVMTLRRQGRRHGLAARRRVRRDEGDVRDDEHGPPVGRCAGPRDRRTVDPGR